MPKCTLFYTSSSGYYFFECWNTSADGTGDEYDAGSEWTLTESTVFYAVYAKRSNETPSSEYINLDGTTSYEMSVGESVELYLLNYIEFSVQSGTDTVSIDGTTLTAVSAGTAVIQGEDCLGRTYSCTVTVTADSSGESEDSALVGTWYDDDSYIVFNADGTGYMKVYLNGSVVQDASFTWSAWENSYGTFLKLDSDDSDYISKQYTITVSSTTLKLKGYLAFGKPQTTTWRKSR